ncbi:MAG: hypothetical protein WBA76_18075, partial [Phormidesmis sp.]
TGNKQQNATEYTTTIAAECATTLKTLNSKAFQRSLSGRATTFADYALFYVVPVCVTTYAMGTSIYTMGTRQRKGNNNCEGVRKICLILRSRTGDRHLLSSAELIALAIFGGGSRYSDRAQSSGAAEGLAAVTVRL